MQKSNKINLIYTLSNISINYFFPNHDELRYENKEAFCFIINDFNLIFKQLPFF